MRFMGFKSLGLVVAAVMPAQAQGQSGDAQLVIAIPALPTPKNVDTEGGQTGVVGIQIAELIESDLRSTGVFFPIARNRLRVYTPTEAGAPIYQNWTNTGAGALVAGYVQARSDGRITVACYLYDLKQRREMARQGFAVAATEWRRAAHRCADVFYAAVTGRPGHFDSRIAYVAESGARTAPVTRLASLNWDGTDHRYLTAGETTVMSPRFSPDGRRIAYMSFAGGTPHVRIMDADGNNDRPLVQGPAMSFAPRFSPDGRRIAFSMASDGNTDVYVTDVDGGYPQRLTTIPGIDTAPSFSPDGERIAFESDRGGAQQIYVMNSDGSGQRRLSFGGGGYATPAWSPDGKRIAFTRSTGSGLAIGTMAASGGDERMLTNGWQDEAPSWAPDSEFLVFNRTTQGTGISNLYTIAVGGGEAKRLGTPQAGSDPSWSGGSK